MNAMKRTQDTSVSRTAGSLADTEPAVNEALANEALANEALANEARSPEADSGVALPTRRPASARRPRRHGPAGRTAG